VIIPKFAPTPRTPPEELAILVLVGAHKPAVGGNEFDAQQVVDGKSVPALQAAHPAPEGQARYSGVPDHPDRAGQPDGLRRLIELAEVSAGAHARSACSRIDRDTMDRPQVQHHAAVTGGESCGAVPAAANGDGQFLLARESDRRDNVLHAAAPRDAGGVAVEDRVPHRPGLVIVRIAGQNHPAAEPSSEGSHCGAVQPKVSFHHADSPSNWTSHPPA
jgi:hypothetical protein